MNSLHVILLAVLCTLTGCQTTEARPVSLTSKELLGAYSNPDLRFSTRVELHADGSFAYWSKDKEAEAQAEIEGRAASDPPMVQGHWTVDGSTVSLEATATPNTHFQKRFFTIFLGNQIALAPAARSTFHESDPLERTTYLFRQMNQTPLPTKAQ